MSNQTASGLECVHEAAKLLEGVENSSGLEGENAAREKRHGFSFRSSKRRMIPTSGMPRIGLETPGFKERRCRHCSASPAA